MPDFSRYAKSYDEHLKANLPCQGESSGFSHSIKWSWRDAGSQMCESGPCSISGVDPGAHCPISLNRFPEAEVWAYDPSEPCTEEAKRQLPAAKVVSREEDIPTNRFDCVFLCNVLHHVPRSAQEDVLCCCRDVLDARGSLFVFEHNPYNPLTRLVFHRCPFDQDAEMLRRSVTCSLAQNAGLRVVDAGYCLFLPVATGGIYRIEDFLGWLPLGAQYYVQCRS